MIKSSNKNNFSKNKNTKSIILEATIIALVAGSFIGVGLGYYIGYHRGNG